MKKIFITLLISSLCSVSFAQTPITTIDSTALEQSIYSNKGTNNVTQEIIKLESKKGRLTDKEKTQLVGYYVSLIKKDKLNYQDQKVSPQNIEKMLYNIALKGDMQSISYLFYINARNGKYNDALKWIYFALDYPNMDKDYHALIKTENFLKTKIPYQEFKVINKQVVALFKKAGVYHSIPSSSKTKSNELLFSKIAKHQAQVAKDHNKEDTYQLFNLYIDGILTQVIPMNEPESSLQSFEKNIRPFAMKNDRYALNLLSMAGAVYNNNEYALLWALVAQAHPSNTPGENEFLQGRIDRVSKDLNPQQIKKTKDEAQVILNTINKK